MSGFRHVQDTEGRLLRDGVNVDPSCCGCPRAALRAALVLNLSVVPLSVQVLCPVFTVETSPDALDSVKNESAGLVQYKPRLYNTMYKLVRFCWVGVPAG